MIPFTVIKTRFESNSYNYKNTYQAFKNILKLEGLRGLTSGLGPTLFRDVPFSGLYLMFYEHLKSLVPDNYKTYNPSAAHFICGFTAGILASLVTQPADVIKTNMQLDRLNKGLVMTVRSIYLQQGPGQRRQSSLRSPLWTLPSM